MSALAASVSHPPEQRTRPKIRLVLFLLAGALAYGAIAAELSLSSGSSRRVIALAAIFIPVVLWKRPKLGPAILMSAAILVEQSGGGHIPITPSLHLFEGLGPVHLQPADLLIASLLIIWLIKTAGEPRLWPRSHMSVAMLALLSLVVVGVFVIGAHNGGDQRNAFMECRPYVYLAATYLLTSVLITTRPALQAVLWGFVITTGFKAVQTLYVYKNERHMTPRPESFIGHEPAFFFTVFIVLVAALWLFGVQGRLRTVGTYLLPVVIFANLVNDRRAAWLMLGGAIVVLLVVAYHGVPKRRRVLGWVVMGMIAAATAYFPVFWNGTDSLAQPARALKSQVQPSARDASSDEYRVQENVNLKINIAEGGLLGKGFGVPIDYAQPITNISDTDPTITYVPHNGVLYTLMRMGLPGGVAMWMLMGTAIIAGCRLAKSVDRQMGVVGVVTAAAVVAYALEGATDKGFFWYRIAFVMGTLMGLTEAGRRLQRAGGPLRTSDKA